MFAAGFLVAVACIAGVNASTLIEITNPRSDELRSRGFELTRGGSIVIDAVGLQRRHSDDFSVYAWIVDHETREPVWTMRPRRSDRRRGSSMLYEVSTTRDFEPGKYELYLFSSDAYRFQWDADDVNDFFGRLFGGSDEEYDDSVEECFVRLSSDELSPSDVRWFDVVEEQPEALVRLTRVGDDESVSQAFRLKKTGKLRIYAIYEHPADYDYPVDMAWIADANTRERVWRTHDWDADWAGGGRKNRVFDDEVELPAGDYILHYVTDDSHSWDEFNSNPPYDPINWGVTLYPGRGFDPRDFVLIDAPAEPEPLVDLTRMRDDDYAEQAFELTKDARLRVYAIGEYWDSEREFVDYGWIQEAGSSKTVWEMTYANTDHAGGAEKNRFFDGFVTLPKGTYVAHYITDGSHSYRRWNAAKPFDPRAWGLAIYPGPDFDAKSIKLLTDDQLRSESDVLVEITRVRDNARLRQRFALDETTRLHIYALGEGDDGEMYDYAFIVDEKSGKAVWEMTWRSTDHAGGADKNRVFDGDVILDPGEYEVFYISDGSHSFGDWNAERPRDPQRWGVTIRIPDH